MTAPPAPYDLLAATWPAESSEIVGPWWAQSAPGAGRRVCSVWPLIRGADALAAGLGAATAWQAARGLDALLQLPDGLDLPSVSAATGWASEGATAILSADAAAVAARSRRGAGFPYLIEVTAPLGALDEVWAEGGIGGARRAVIARAEGIGRIWAARLDSRLAGAAFVGRVGDRAAIQALHVAPWARRRGAAHDLMVACAGWAAAAGADRLVWSVERDNAPALALYAALGAVEIGGYRYWRRSPG